MTTSQPTPQNGQEEWKRKFSNLVNKYATASYLESEENGPPPSEEMAELIAYVETLLSQREAAARREERERVLEQAKTALIDATLDNKANPTHLPLWQISKVLDYLPPEEQK